MDRDADRRATGGPHPRRVFKPQPELIGATDTWAALTWAEPHWAIAVDDAETDAETYATAHGPTCAQCRSVADAMLQARQAERR